jgi:hypothetical protein
LAPVEVASLVEEALFAEAGAVEADTVTTPCDTITPDALALDVRSPRSASEPNPPPVELEVLELELLDPSSLPIVGIVMSAGSRPAAASAIRLAGGELAEVFGGRSSC